VQVEPIGSRSESEPNQHEAEPVARTQRCLARILNPEDSNQEEGSDYRQKDLRNQHDGSERIELAPEAPHGAEQRSCAVESGAVGL